MGLDDMPEWAVPNRVRPMPDGPDDQLPAWAIPKPTVLVETPAEADYVLCVDVSNLAWRNAFAHEALKTEDGTPSGAVFGSLMELTSKLGRLRSGRWCFAFCYDGPGARAARCRILPTYKASRDERDEAKTKQVAETIRVIGSLRGIHVCEPEREGDDAIAWVVEQCRGEVPVLILSSDKDTWSLIGDGVGVLSPTKNRYVTVADIAAKFAVDRPDQLALAKSLYGDDGSDNIRGIPRLNKEAMAAYLQPQVTTPEALYALLDVNSYGGLTRLAREKLIAGRPVVDANFAVASAWLSGFGGGVRSLSGDASQLSADLDRYAIRSIAATVPSLVGGEVKTTGVGFGPGWPD